MGPEHMHDLMDQARQLGAHHVLRRIEFSTVSTLHSPAAIAADIQSHLLDNGTVSTCEVRAEPHDPGIQGLLHQVGEATVARLYAKILESGGHQAERIDLRFLTQGASGASVCAVTAHLTGNRRMSHILKLSRAKDQLVREAERGKRAAEVLPPRTCSSNTGRSILVGPVNGWYALRWPVHGQGHHVAQLVALRRAFRNRCWRSTGGVVHR